MLAYLEYDISKCWRRLKTPLHCLWISNYQEEIGWDSIKRFNHAIIFSLSQIRIWIFDAICRVCLRVWFEVKCVSSFVVFVFVYIGRIGDHHILNCLFIIVPFLSASRFLVGFVLLNIEFCVYCFVDRWFSFYVWTLY